MEIEQTIHHGDGHAHSHSNVPPQRGVGRQMRVAAAFTFLMARERRSYGDGSVLGFHHCGRLNRGVSMEEDTERKNKGKCNGLAPGLRRSGKYDDNNKEEKKRSSRKI